METCKCLSHRAASLYDAKMLRTLIAGRCFTSLKFVLDCGSQFVRITSVRLENWSLFSTNKLSLLNVNMDAKNKFNRKLQLTQSYELLLSFKIKLIKIFCPHKSIRIYLLGIIILASPITDIFNAELKLSLHTSTFMKGMYKYSSGPTCPSTHTVLRQQQFAEVFNFRLAIVVATVLHPHKYFLLFATLRVVVAFRVAGVDI